MTFAYSLPKADARALGVVLRAQGFTVTGDNKASNSSGYRVTVHDEGADPAEVDAIARSVSPQAKRLP